MVENISDLIAMNSQAALIPGVQLEWYGNPDKEADNERLVSSYIFSSGAATQGAAPAVTIFGRIRDSLTQSGTHNVFTVIAHYGHGKSHFALVLANYFGRRAGDPALDKLLDQLEACTDRHTAYHFRQFKKNAGKPQLVVRLSGHDFTNLRQGFLSALRRALEVRDGYCQHGSVCDVPARDCDGDHKIAWSNGGRTIQCNGQMLCAFHNRLKGDCGCEGEAGGLDDVRPQESRRSGKDPPQHDAA